MSFEYFSKAPCPDPELGGGCDISKEALGLLRFLRNMKTAAKAIATTPPATPTPIPIAAP